MRLRSSGGRRDSHKVRGTTPNIAPPSSWKNPSDTVINSRSPSAWRVGVRNSGTRAAGCFSSTSTPWVADGWMKATRAPSAPGPGHGVDQADAAAGEIRERRIDVFHAQGDVMHAGPALLDELRNRRVGRRRLQQFQRRGPQVQEVGAHALAGHLFRGVHVQAEHIAEEGERLLHVLHRDAEVIDPDLHRRRRLRVRMSSAAE